jgi:hypothetical protein
MICLPSFCPHFSDLNYARDKPLIAVSDQSAAELDVPYASAPRPMAEPGPAARSVGLAEQVKRSQKNGVKK